jgi:uncharacterized protein
MNSDYDDVRPPVSLTLVERQTLQLLHEILQHLDADEADYHRQMVEVLAEGFTMEYEKVFTPFSELPKDDCRLVFDILDMFRVIKTSLGDLEESERDVLLADYEQELTFRGFDGNDARESRMASYVAYLLATGRWTDLREDVQSADHGNSHWPTLSTYTTMLRTYQPIWDELVRNRREPRFRLTVDELRQVAASAA